jgi:hypothetical protein
MKTQNEALRKLLDDAREAHKMSQDLRESNPAESAVWADKAYRSLMQFEELWALEVNKKIDDVLAQMIII